MLVNLNVRIYMRKKYIVHTWNKSCGRSIWRRPIVYLPPIMHFAVAKPTDSVWQLLTVDRSRTYESNPNSRVKMPHPIKMYTSTITYKRFNIKTKSNNMAESKKKCRQYNIEYINYGFIPSPTNIHLPMCLICEQVFSNEAMKPSRLKDHLNKALLTSKKTRRPRQRFASLGGAPCGLRTVRVSPCCGRRPVTSSASGFPNLIPRWAGIQPSSPHADEVPQPSEFGGLRCTETETDISAPRC